jgi:hypothetical protein
VLCSRLVIYWWHHEDSLGRREEGRLSSCAEVLESSSSATIGQDVELFEPSEVVVVALVVLMTADAQQDELKWLSVVH